MARKHHSKVVPKQPVITSQEVIHYRELASQLIFLQANLKSAHIIVGGYQRTLKHSYLDLI